MTPVKERTKLAREEVRIGRSETGEQKEQEIQELYIHEKSKDRIYVRSYGAHEIM